MFEWLFRKREYVDAGHLEKFHKELEALGVELLE
jgi:hypothetical protein